ncbi:MAG TPA: diaminopimelate decarboxylase [Verrucomicrobiae bacterium]|nr:diaminopimelate decarboxylase [Verrucomicrobiae bacterium]
MPRAKKSRDSSRLASGVSAIHAPFYSFRHDPGSRTAAPLQLSCEGVALERIAKSAKTPTYVYSQASIESAYRILDRSLSSLPHTLCYAVKANSNLSVLRVFGRLGSSFDIVSGGELDRLGRIGVSGDRVVFSGAGKSREEIREALRFPGRDSRSKGILLFNVESESEFEILLSEAGKILSKGGSPASASIRVNPDVLAGGHPHISTGHHRHKFGMTWADARRLYLAHQNSRSISWRGISAHIGSQILSVAPYRRAVARLASYYRDLTRQGIALRFLDIGGGFGIRYTKEAPLDAARLARTLAPIVRPLRCRLLLEPGRFLVGPAGVLLTRVLFVKKTGGKTFVIVDAAMNDLIRPVLYGAVHPIAAVRQTLGSPASPAIVDVVGPVCETGDFLARGISLPPVNPGDLLVVTAAGAYGFAQSSNYNSRPRAAEVLVHGNRFRIVRRRETRADIVRAEL